MPNGHPPRGEAPFELQEPVQPANHERYATLRPQRICGENNRHLHAVGPVVRGKLSEGSKWFCGLHFLRSDSPAAPPINVLSIGSNNNFVFEASLVRMLGRRVRIHTLDCTVSRPAVPPELRGHVTFHRICVGAHDSFDPFAPSAAAWHDARSDARSRMLRWPTLVRWLRNGGAAPPMVGPLELLKMDCEGAEKEVLWDMLTAGDDADLPRQIAVELHSIALYRDLGATTYAGSRRISAGELSLLGLQWHHKGYRLVQREDNPPQAANTNNVCPCGGAPQYSSCCASEMLLLRTSGCA